MDEKQQYCTKIFYMMNRRNDHLVREMLGEIEEVLARYPDLEATIEED